MTTLYFLDQPSDIELDTGLLYQSVKFRVGHSNFFVGGNLAYINPKLVFDEPPGFPVGRDTSISKDEKGMSVI